MTCLASMALLLTLCGPTVDAGPHLSDMVTEPRTWPSAPLAVALGPPPPPYVSWATWRALSPPSSPFTTPPVDLYEEARVLAGVVADREREAAERATERAEQEAAEQAEQAAAAAVEQAELEQQDSEPTSTRQVWDDLADCESGNWVNGGASFETGSARWHVGGTDHRAQERPPWSNGLFYGGVQFTLKSWAWAADVGGHDVDPNPANNSREEQIAVAETLKDLQGPGAWPTCGPKVDLR